MHTDPHERLDKVLHLHFSDRVTSVGWSFLTSYLSNPDCSLQKLVLAPGTISDRDNTALLNSLAMNNTTVRLDLEIHHSNPSLRWLGISTGLKSPNSALVRLDMSSCNVNDEGALLIAVALTGNTALKSLKVGYKNSVTPAGWILFFQLLLDSGFNSCLEELSLISTKIDDKGAALLAEWLVASTSLKNLDLSHSQSVTASGWVKCVGVMAAAELVLENLALCGTTINDEGDTMLADLLNATSTLASLDLGSTAITTNGLSVFADVLRRPSSNLKVLTINYCNDDFICNLATALAHNANLEVLDALDFNITDRGWRAMESTLCDISSIGAIYNSNHTLHTLDLGYLTCSDTIEYLLEVNYNRNKVEVARTKILQFYLSDVAAIRPAFDGLAMSVLPIAVAWLGRDRRGFSTLYHLLQGMPSLYSHSDP